MVVLIVILLIVIFITADVLIRFITQKIQERKIRKEREEALDIGLKLEVADEAKSLRRVNVDHPKALILAVDDESIVLDSFRKILVFAGYSIDTVENGKEAVGLVQKNDYDFVFTDLKMPEMDGIEVTKTVKHIRPDIDVIVITGYATIESAVETMKFGAMDYVQKPFTEDELVNFVNKLLIRRLDKKEKQMIPKVHLVTASSGTVKSDHVFNVPAGIFFSPEHTWVRIEPTGEIRIGIDDFVQKTIGKIDKIILPKNKQIVSKGQPLFTIKQNSRTFVFPSPTSGRISKVNIRLADHAEFLHVNPYEIGWLCCMEVDDLMGEIQHLKIGASAIEWYHNEINKLKDIVEKISQQKQKEAENSREKGALKDPFEIEDIEIWKAFSNTFLHA